jgi:hypothetical protein
VSDSQRSNQHGEAFGMLVSTLQVRLVEVSRTGCLVEVARHLEPGTNGQLQLDVEGLLHIDDVRVCRCRMREGASRGHYAGVELLRTRRLSRRSLRLAMRRIIGEHHAPAAHSFQESVTQPTFDGRESRRRREGCRAPPVPAETET